VSDRPQRTIGSEIRIDGVGLHTGETANLRVRPADAGHGIIFRRTDLEDGPEIPARIEFMHDAPRRTCLKAGTAEVHTTEHLLAALVAAGVDNAVCELDGPEVPGADGSSLPFLEAIEKARVKDQKERAIVHTLREPVHVADGDWTIVALPHEEGLRLDYTLAFDTPRVIRESMTLCLTHEGFRDTIAPARTFVTSEEIAALREAGLGKGASEQNTVVISDDAEHDGARMRFPDEPLRHKVLDLIGDLALLGRPLHARIVAQRTGHVANRRLVRKIAAEMHKSEELGHLRHGSGLGIAEIMRVLPHRYPMLLVDRVIELDGFKRAVGIKNVTINEPFFVGHYPETPIMPAVLTLEALAQLAGILLLRKLDYAGKVAVFLGMDNVRLRHAVMPGDQLRLMVETVHLGRRGGKVSARASVRDTLVAEAEMKFMLVDSPSNVEDHVL